jgi:crotonobetainyl-CoA:carnitine CoA-transferase CaiB-like acyl-CoA transferase
LADGQNTTGTQTVDPNRPLEGLVVVEIGHSVAAPFAGHVLGDLGATVVKIENPDGGDDARKWGPPFWHGAAFVFQALNRNKYSAAIDMKDAAQCASLRQFIVEKADIVLQNMRPGLIRKLGLDASLRAENPRLIYCNLAAFGSKGPLVDRPGYDPLMQAFGGIMSVTGEDGRPPVRVGPSLVDVGTGMWAVIGALAAVHRRHLTGEGCEIDTSLFETALSWVNTHAAGYLASGKVPGRRGSEHAGMVPYKIFEAADGYVMIAAGNDNLFRRLAGVLVHPEWLDDPRFATNPERVKHRDIVNAAIQDVIATQPTSHWVDALERVSVPCAPLQTMDQVLDHPQTKALEILQTTPDGKMSLIGLPVSFDGQRPPLRRGPPALGADTAIIIGPSVAGDAIPANENVKKV